MAASKSLSLTTHQSGALLSPREEAARFEQASERLLERARQDPRVAEKFLRAIGYYEMMEDQDKEETTEKASVSQTKTKKRGK